MSIWEKLFGQKAAGGGGAALSSEESEDLAAEPISRGRMDLIWFDPQTLSLLEITGGATVLTDDGGGGARDLHSTPEDIEWAKQVLVYSDKAQKAGERGDHQAAIRLYREALKLAPGGDMFLMSMGCCYANMGKPRIGIKYLQRAAEISPENQRIRKNLAGVQKLL